MRKGQTALEYLMTYGWAILIVIIVVAALFALGLTKPCNWTGTQVGTMPSGFSTDRGSIKMSDSGNSFVIKLTNNGPDVVTFDSATPLTFAVSGTSFSDTWPDSGTVILTVGQSTDINANITGPVQGDCYAMSISGPVLIGTTTHDFYAAISGKVES